MSGPLMKEHDYALTGSADEGIFGIPSSPESAALVYIPVPWEVTTSYGDGTAQGPSAILNASPQLDLFTPGVNNHYQSGFSLLTADENIARLNAQFKPVAKQIQAVLETEGSLRQHSKLAEAQAAINRASEAVNEAVYRQAQAFDREGKAVALIGGDHSSPLGLIRYLGEKYQGQFGILHIDAHMDLRDAYQGFTYSHASIMHNVLALDKAPQALVQVGIRDFCEEEYNKTREDNRIRVFFDETLREALYGGRSFAQVADEIVNSLPSRVYISFDIDGLKPEFCPGTGTPVPGGLDYEEARFLIRALVKAGKEIIGFDLCEVAPRPDHPDDEWDGNVGARVLFTLSTWMMESRQ